jgi:hypothetical protein
MNDVNGRGVGIESLARDPRLHLQFPARSGKVVPIAGGHEMATTTTPTTATESK